MSKVSRWVNQLNNKQLPIFSHTQNLLNKLVDDPATTLENYNQIILKDPGLIIQLLRDVNCDKKRHRSSSIKTIDHVAILLGMNNMKRIATQMPAIEKIKIENIARQQYLHIASGAYHAGFQAQDWEKLMNYRLPQEALVASQLRSAFELAIWAYGNPEDLTKLNQLLTRKDMTYEEAHEEILGSSMNHLGLNLAEQWCFPESVLHSFSDEEVNFPRSKNIVLADQLVKAVADSWENEKTDCIIASISEHIHIAPEKLKQRIMTSAVEASEETKFIAIDHPGLQVIEIRMREENETKIAAESNDTTDAESTAAIINNEQEKDPSPQEDMALSPDDPKYLKQVMQMLADTDKGEPLPINQIISTSIRAIQKGLGMDRVFFAMLTKDKKDLMVRYSADTFGSAADIQHLKISMKQKHLFTIIMSKPQNIFVNQSNRDKLGHLIPKVLISKTDEALFFAGSVFVQGRPLGIFYADRYHTGIELKTDQYHHFKTICAYVSNNIERLSLK